MSDDNKWIDEWYTELEKGLTNYKRPDDWLERMLKAKDTVRKPVRNQYEGRKGSNKHEDN
jgi:hypothetical protein